MRVVKTDDQAPMRSLNDEMALMASSMLGRVTLPGVPPPTRWQRMHEFLGLSRPSLPMGHSFLHHVASTHHAAVCRPIHPDRWVTLGHRVRLTYAEQGDVVIFHSGTTPSSLGTMGFFLRSDAAHIHCLTMDSRSVVRPVRRLLTTVRDIRRLEPLNI